MCRVPCAVGRVAACHMCRVQGTAPDIIEYIARRAEWRDDLNCGQSLSSSSEAPAWHRDVVKTINWVPCVVATGAKRGLHSVYRYAPELDPDHAPRRKARSKGLAGVPLQAGPCHAPHA